MFICVKSETYFLQSAICARFSSSESDANTLNDDDDKDDDDVLRPPNPLALLLLLLPKVPGKIEEQDASSPPTLSPRDALLLLLFVTAPTQARTGENIVVVVVVIPLCVSLCSCFFWISDDDLKERRVSRVSRKVPKYLFSKSLPFFFWTFCERLVDSLLHN